MQLSFPESGLRDTIEVVPRGYFDDKLLLLLQYEIQKVTKSKVV